ncbi:uncharacterized protein LOC123525122 [Mercenaria mercenaria]|uniref:uncharacterized protein LOC123525122 n=1 Tax=Mercenaria mercenaria TaxID=6596 RepID=UPI00234E96F9|nr:uncharacterized protein LOC123525122 [Mercenaria mercenaria]XP_045159810.2 uncharacterized protein LOC123525122 [Mercenaria mercenaria]XP_045159811.2 uncharacterized protein LOC123525122 [Mercenaria mercenaria]XP_053394130.1 uncharacterized protein LOC123525122 [Mercenaria mercenaria]
MDNDSPVKTENAQFRNGRRKQENMQNGKLTNHQGLSSDIRLKNSYVRGKNGVNTPQESGNNGHPSGEGPGKLNDTGLFHLTNTVILPLLVMTLLPTFIMALVYANTDCNGSISGMLSRFHDQPISYTFAQIWGKNLGNIGFFTFAVILGYYIWAVFCTKMLPGKTVKGPMTHTGNTPVYVDNGLYCYLLTMAGFGLFTVLLKMNDLTPTFVLDHFGEMAAFMNVYSYIFVFMLYIKGIYTPSTTDSGRTGKGFIFDYYWGTELYPRVFGIDIKVLTNCRFALTVWPLLVCICALKSYELYGFVDSMLVTTILQLFYITKFFIWEAGYYGTMDIVQDRAGFYIIWGCLSLLPPLYPIASFYLVNHPVRLGPFWTSILLIAGISSTTVNYLADRQKLVVRRTNGNCKIWGKRPDLIRAKYLAENGEVGESILLASGWWSISRHFHYIPEILLAFCWTVTAGFEDLLPYSYLIFLTILLVHRSFRDEKKCSKKYGEYWQQYCSKVKYRILPYIF